MYVDEKGFFGGNEKDFLNLSMSLWDAILLFMIEEENKKIKWKLRIGLIEKAFSQVLFVIIEKEKMERSIALDIEPN